MKSRWTPSTVLLAAVAFAFGCSPHQGSAASASASLEKHPSVSDKAEPPKRVTNRPGNKMGRVYIAMYHHIRSGRGPMFRTVKQFRADLEFYYKLGFRPVLASEYIANKMPLPPGASPIVMTFDDSNPSQIQLKKDGSVDPKSAVGIWMAFAKEHPDFPVHGTFFSLPDSMWGNPAQKEQKIKILRDLGSEIGNHTVNHPFLNRLSDKRVEYELGRCTEMLEDLGIEPPDLVAVPYGVYPKNSGLLKGFKFHGKKITFAGVFRADGPPARSPEDPQFNKLRIPRMTATKGAGTVIDRMKRIAKGDYPPYVQP